jgi:DeoR/GlpR family transcriptional regulator of sugar metabolism
MSDFDRNEMLTPGARLRLIEELLAERGSLSLRDALTEINVSEMTLRRDFASLERLGLVERTWGGILPKRPLVPELGHNEREQTEAGAKRTIAELADGCIDEGDTVLLSGGTTALAVARRLARRSHLTVITTSLPALLVLAENSELVVIALGGRMSPYNNDTSGPQALAALTGYRADKAVIGATGLREDGVFNANADRAAIDRMMVERANSTLVVADHTKVGRSALSLVNPWAPTLSLVTDLPLPRHARHWLQQSSARVVAPRAQVSTTAGPPEGSSPARRPHRSTNPSNPLRKEQSS